MTSSPNFLGILGVSVRIDAEFNSEFQMQLLVSSFESLSWPSELILRILEIYLQNLTSHGIFRFHLEHLESSLLFSAHFNLAGSGNGSGYTMMLPRMLFIALHAVKL